MSEMNYELHHGDCLEVMRTLPDASVDAVITDPPYGTTACKWDSVIPFEPMWKELRRIAKPKAAICLFGSQPFTSALVMSNVKMFRYEWVWDKHRAGNFFAANSEPLRVHEAVLVFSHGLTTYSPQVVRGLPYRIKRNGEGSQVGAYGRQLRMEMVNTGQRHPVSILDYGTSANSDKPHPTQKPVELLRYLIRTYTNEGETVLDFTMGSGSTGVACELENRKFIGIEKDENYFTIAKERIEGVMNHEPLFMEQAA